ncbi:histidine phosphatase superfamily [Protomyces lactucae-debilis]|uniref:Histidine phosphatase superfamily n=1 Tax=Protomyces lactucae-debilis TaxID=2754530 RepID=A0A1Y2FS40_PROLT|nr:histidine phosphatase superfamily [Protomyces lactucae-debilis]ORY85525.1 histidine phosphatase superfamily [Protomyces lactucae-debilis]
MTQSDTEAAGLHEFFFLRHGERRDQRDSNWRLTSPTPYDSPLTYHGAIQALLTGQAIAQHSQGTRFVIHTSPFLRCIQTSLALAAALPTRPVLRIDAFLGEWMTPDYYKDIQPPPAMSELVQSARQTIQSLVRKRKLAVEANAEPQNFSSSVLQDSDFPYDPSNVQLDIAWDSQQFGPGGELGEDWPEMHDRVRRGLHRLIDNFDQPTSSNQPRTVVILVSHAAGCNAMLGAVTGRPVLKDVELCSLSHAVARDCPHTHVLSAAAASLSETLSKRSARLSQRYILLMTADSAHLNQEQLDLLPAGKSPLGSACATSPDLEQYSSSWSWIMATALTDECDGA